MRLVTAGRQALFHFTVAVLGLLILAPIAPDFFETSEVLAHAEEPRIIFVGLVSVLSTEKIAATLLVSGSLHCFLQAIS